MVNTESKAKTTVQSESDKYDTFLPTPTEQDALNRVFNDFTTGRLVINKSYNYFNNRTLFDCIDDWTMRWNGYTSPLTPVDETSSNIFLNFTRNLIISYLSKVAQQPIDPKIKAVNTKTGLVNQKFAQVMVDLNQYTLDSENAPAKFMMVALECTVKGTAIVYEGYLKTTTKRKYPKSFDSQTGKIDVETKEVVDFDNCYQRLVKLEDFYIANPWTPNLQDQPWVIWKEITTYDEAAMQYKKYKNWGCVKPGAYTILAEPTTYYTNQIYTELQKNQVEVLRYYNRRENVHTLMVNGIVLYTGPLPFKHGKYPFAKYIFEPFGADFFWGAGAPFKIMGEQDTQNTFINMMIDKQYGSLMPFGLTSDIDDVIEDDQLAPNKIRKVGDITKWKFDTLPGVSGGEMEMFQTMLNLLKDNSGMTGGAQQYSPKGGKLNVRQILLQQQEAMQALGFPIGFLEDGERDRTELRLKNIYQFFSIPKIEAVAGKDGSETVQETYKEARVYDTHLSDGRKGTKIMKLISPDDYKNKKKRKKIADQLSVTEEMGEQTGTPTEAIAVPVSMFDEHDMFIQVVKNSSYHKNQALEQAERQEYAQWRLSLIQVAPVDAVKLVEWVDESYDIDPDQFKVQTQPGQQGQPGQQPATPGQIQQMAPGQPGISPGGGAPGSPAQSPAQRTAPSTTQLSPNIGGLK